MNGCSEKIILISDSHRTELIAKLATVVNPATILVHCGDGVDDVTPLACRYPRRMVCVKGNNDFCSSAPREIILALNGFNVLVTHGDAFGVRNGLTAIAQAARVRNCSVVFFGHSHRFTDTVINGVRLINPGALCNGSYAEVAFCGGDALCEHKRIDR